MGEKYPSSSEFSLDDEIDAAVNETIDFDTRAETAGRLGDHFGDQKFMYATAAGPQTGTFGQMLSVCPAVEDILDLGFDRAVASLNAYAISDEEYAKLLEPEKSAAEDEQQEVDDENIAKEQSARNAQSEVESAKKIEASETNKTEQRGKHVEQNEQVYSRIILADQLVAEPEVIESNIPDMLQGVAAPLKINDEHQSASMPEAAAIMNDSSDGDSSENIPTPLPEIPQSPSNDTVTFENIAEGNVDDPVAHMTVINSPDASGEMSDAPRLAVESRISTDQEASDTSGPRLDGVLTQDASFLYTEVVTDLNEAHAEIDTSEASYEAVVEEFAVDEEVREETPYKVESISEEYERRTIGTATVPEESTDKTEALFPTETVEVPAEILDAHLFGAEADDEMRVDSKTSEVYEAAQSFLRVYEHENEVQTESLVDREAVEEVIEIVTGFTETEPDFELAATPIEVVKHVDAIQQSIKKLEQADTKEECAEHVEALQKSLAELLESLGFARSQELARQLVRQYDTKTLKQFIAALMKSVTAGEVAQHGLQKKVLPINHHWFGKRVVERVVRSATGAQLQAA